MADDLEQNTIYDVTDFLLNNLNVTDVTAEVYPSDRFIQAGKPFVIRAMSPDEFESFQKQCNKIRFVKGRRETEFNNKRFNELIVLTCTKTPNFKDAETLKKAGCTTPEQFIYKALLSGEIMNLAGEISALSGFDKTLDEVKDEVKND